MTPNMKTTSKMKMSQKLRLPHKWRWQENEDNTKNENDPKIENYRDLHPYFVDFTNTLPMHILLCGIFLLWQVPGNDKEAFSTSRMSKDEFERKQPRISKAEV